MYILGMRQQPGVIHVLSQTCQLSRIVRETRALRVRLMRGHSLAISCSHAYYSSGVSGCVQWLNSPIIASFPGCVGGEKVAWE